MVDINNHVPLIRDLITAHKKHIHSAEKQNKAMEDIIFSNIELIKKSNTTQDNSGKHSQKYNQK